MDTNFKKQIKKVGGKFMDFRGGLPQDGAARRRMLTTDANAQHLDDTQVKPEAEPVVMQRGARMTAENTRRRATRLVRTGRTGARAIRELPKDENKRMVVKLPQKNTPQKEPARLELNGKESVTTAHKIIPEMRDEDVLVKVKTGAKLANEKSENVKKLADTEKILNKSIDTSVPTKEVGSEHYGKVYNASIPAQDISPEHSYSKTHGANASTKKISPEYSYNKYHDASVSTEDISSEYLYSKPHSTDTSVKEINSEHLYNKKPGASITKETPEKVAIKELNIKTPETKIKKLDDTTLEQTKKLTSMSVAPTTVNANTNFVEKSANKTAEKLPNIALKPTEKSTNEHAKNQTWDKTQESNLRAAKLGASGMAGRVRAYQAGGYTGTRTRAIAGMQTGMKRTPEVVDVSETSAVENESTRRTSVAAPAREIPAPKTQTRYGYNNGRRLQAPGALYKPRKPEVRSQQEALSVMAEGQLDDVTIPVPEPSDDIEDIEFGLIEELDMKARHPQPVEEENKPTEAEKTGVVKKGLGTALPWRKAKRGDADSKKLEEVEGEKQASKYKSPFLKSVQVEKRPLSSAASASTLAQRFGKSVQPGGKVSGVAGAGSVVNAVTKTGGLSGGTGVKTGASTTGAGTSAAVAAVKKASLPRFDGLSKERSREVGPTMIVSQGSRLRSNIGLGIAVTLTVLVGGVVGLCVCLALFQ